METYLRRYLFTQKSTIGDWVIGSLTHKTLEDCARARKIAHVTCIPPGRYEIRITQSARYSGLYGVPVFTLQLMGVPEYEGFRVHSGSTDVDTDGCIITGMLAGVNQIMGSCWALLRTCLVLWPLIERGERCFVTITNEGNFEGHKNTPAYNA